jgi:FkbM family methyltransferase
MEINLVSVLQTHNVNPVSVLHIGAHLAQELHDYKRAGCLKGTFIEGDPTTFERLNEVLKNEDSFTAIEALLSDEDGAIVDFFKASNDGMSSSFLKPGSHLIEHPEVLFDSTPLKLKTKKLDSLNLGSFDLLVLDVQGAELQVLRGGMNTLLNAKAVVLEVSIRTLYEGDSTINELIAFVTPFGFSPVSLHINSHGWGDCILIKIDKK